MTPLEYLKKVHNTVANLGHRSVPSFLEAFTVAGQAANSSFSNEVLMVEARRVRDCIARGLVNFVPGSPWFDAKTATAYAFLTADFNSVTHPGR